MAVGERIQEARIRAGMKQSDLAKKIGVAVITIGQYERGKRQPSLDQLRNIADALNADIVYLISGQTSAEVEEGILVQAEAEARDALKKLQAETKDKSFDERTSLNENIIKLFKLLSGFNPTGHKKAVERVEELTEIPRYRAETAPQSPPVPQEGKDTTLPPDGSEGPQEGE